MHSPHPSIRVLTPQWTRRESQADSGPSCTSSFTKARDALVAPAAITCMQPTVMHRLAPGHAPCSFRVNTLPPPSCHCTLHAAGDWLSLCLSSSFPFSFPSPPGSAQAGSNALRAHLKLGPVLQSERPKILRGRQGRSTAGDERDNRSMPQIFPHRVLPALPRTSIGAAPCNGIRHQRNRVSCCSPAPPLLTVSASADTAAKMECSEARANGSRGSAGPAFGLPLFLTKGPGALTGSIEALLGPVGVERGRRRGPH